MSNLCIESWGKPQSTSRIPYPAANIELTVEQQPVSLVTAKCCINAQNNLWSLEGHVRLQLILDANGSIMQNYNQLPIPTATSHKLMCNS